MKILHLPTATGGNSWGLAQGEKSLGLESDVLVAEGSSMCYPADIYLHLQQHSSPLLKLWKCGKAFLNVRKKYDCFHFNFGRSLVHFNRWPQLQLLDLPFYPEQAKLFVTYNGCDARQKHPTMQRTKISACHNDGCVGGICDSGKLDQSRQQMIKKMSRYVSYMWALNPDLLHFLPQEKASFLPYTVCRYDVPSFPLLGEKKIKIVHAPTNRLIKGSQYIIDAVEKLQRCYPGLIDFTLIEGMPHDQAMRFYQQADVVIDQLLIGWYGAFAVECMLMGKPVIARIAREDLKFVPEGMSKDLLETIIEAGPSTIYEVLERCVYDRDFLRKRSEASVEYARKWHGSKYVASITKEKYESSLCVG